MKIMVFDIEYPMVKNVLRWLDEVSGIKTVVVHLPFPTSNGDMISLAQKTLENNPDIGFAIFSHISSMPALILPVKELTALCRRRNVSVFIDGAHVVGQIPLNIRDIDPDYYVSNAHKWLYSPKGTAFLWVRKDKQSSIVPTVISGLRISDTHSGYEKLFSYPGTADQTGYVAIGAALDFRASFGDKDIMEYIHKLAVEGGNILVKLWNTDKLVDDSMIGAMVNVRVPSTNQSLLPRLTDIILDKYNTFVPISMLPETDKWYCRVSAQIFLELSDFEHFGRILLEVLALYEKESKL